MHDDTVTENRINRELWERIGPAEVIRRHPLQVTALHLESEPVPVHQLDPGDFGPIAPGQRWGRPWGTTWFSVSGQLPEAVAAHSALEVHADIGFSGAMAGFQAEGSVYVDGLIRCGVHPRRRSIDVELVSRDGEVGFLLEGAANPDFSSSFTANPMGDLSTAGTEPLYEYRGIEVREYSPEVRALRVELATLNDLMRSLPAGNPRRARLLRTMSRALDRLDLHDVVATAGEARVVLAEGFEPAAAPDSHRLHAVGHAHIDTAWLWPLRETRRKCARTFSNQVRLMEEYPEHLFACSQAAQYEFVREDHPELFEEIKTLVRQHRWLPVGGMWVEADMNLPSGESLVRQLVAGQRYFEEHFGIRCEEIWIPDVFGYPGTLPQIFRAAGCDRFLTQKLSWNKQNRFPHHSFTWEGIDGSTVVAHFPPVDTYNSELSARELTRAAKNFSDAAWSDHSLVPFGYGDGGGGPTAEMLERARLLADTSGAPSLGIDPPAAFFELLEEELEAPGTPRWRGELYFEMHRGTFTTQARTKVGNRRCEGLLREAELWDAGGIDESQALELDRLWKRVLTQQFHDIIPGSSIAWVHQDAEAEHRAVAERLEQIIASTLARYAGPAILVANAATHDRREVLESGVLGVDHLADLPAEHIQTLSDGSIAATVAVPGMGVAAFDVEPADDAVRVGPLGMSNSSLSVELDRAGNITSVRDLRVGREVLPEGGRGAVLTLAPDHPVEYDAWDLEEWTASMAVELQPHAAAEVLESGPLVGRLRTEHRFGGSTVRRTITLRAGSPRLDVTLDIDWQEDEKLLSIEFPLDVRSDRASCEAQFGYLRRPTHRSTSWDAAKFEVCAHRWVDLSEPGFGVAVLNDGRYGHGVQDGGIRVSLLRAPRYPDPTADRGRHRVTVSLLPHGAGLADVMTSAEALNTPLRVVDRGAEVVDTPVPVPLVSLSDPRVAVSAVKRAHDGSGDLIVRLWEATGDRVELGVTTSGTLTGVERCDLMEERLDGPEIRPDGDGGFALVLRPFELVSLRLQTMSG